VDKVFGLKGRDEIEDNIKKALGRSQYVPSAVYHYRNIGINTFEGKESKVEISLEK